VKTAERELWIAHTAEIGAVASFVAHDTLCGYQAVKTRELAARDVATDGGKVYRIKIIVEEVSP